MNAVWFLFCCVVNACERGDSLVWVGLAATAECEWTLRKLGVEAVVNTKVQGSLVVALERGILTDPLFVVLLRCVITGWRVVSLWFKFSDHHIEHDFRKQRCEC